jgi:peptidoglycan/LPS O-acetylase OafA/YrhL
MEAETQSTHYSLFGSKRIPCIDGLRAISILLVLLAHGRQSLGFPRLQGIPFTGATGVCLFFVISGFLITTLVLDEKERAGCVSLRHFYARRALRIFPAFYCYIAALIVFRHIGWVHFSQASLLSSVTYWRNFYDGPQEWVLGHTWSLSVEEQFYLLWPLLIARLSLRWSTRAGAAVIALWPLLRLLRHGFLFAGTGHVALETAAMDTILYGSLLALLIRSERAGPLLLRFARRPASLYLSVLLLWAIYSTAGHWPRATTFLLPLLRDLSLTCLLLCCVINPRRRIGQWLESRMIASIGIISYSLYLWHVPFIRHSSCWICTFPQNVVAAFAVAVFSYYGVERPCNRLRRRWSVTPAMLPQEGQMGTVRSSPDSVHG